MRPPPSPTRSPAITACPANPTGGRICQGAAPAPADHGAVMVPVLSKQELQRPALAAVVLLAQLTQRHLFPEGLLWRAAPSKEPQIGPPGAELGRRCPRTGWGDRAGGGGRGGRRVVWRC
jgi:hypothetical protein